MTDPPRVSVLVPVHLASDCLKSSLSSILRQTFQDFEVLVCGDGADETVARTAGATGDPRVRWAPFPKAPGYGYSNRSRGIAVARGKLIAYLAPDDLWAPRHLERLVSALDRDRLDMVFSRPVLVWSSGVARPHFAPFDLGRGGSPSRLLLCCLSPSHALHTREIHDRVGGWNDAFRRHGDVDLWLRFRSAGARIGYLRDATAVRFPGYAFGAGREGRQAVLHAEMASRLHSGETDLESLRWGPFRRPVGWAQDIFVVGSAKGAGWGSTLIRRSFGASPSWGSVS